MHPFSCLCGCSSQNRSYPSRCLILTAGAVILSSRRILCGLYGVLRPWDMVKPYRLDMSKKLANPAGKDLYAFWGSSLADIIESVRGGSFSVPRAQNAFLAHSCADCRLAYPHIKHGILHPPRLWPSSCQKPASKGDNTSGCREARLAF